MESRIEEKQRHFQIEKLEERIAPAHVGLPAAIGIFDGPSEAPDANPHFSGKFQPLPYIDPEIDL